MPYTGSAAGVGLSTVISINTSSTTTPTWTAVGELRKASLTGRQTGDADVTNFESSAREFVPTLIESGTWDIEGNRIGGDAGQVAMETAFTTVPPKLSEFKIQLPKTANQTVIGDSFTFNALIKELDYSVEVDKAVTLTGKLKVSGILTVTAGS
jgi:hypothetical protein